MPALDEEDAIGAVLSALPLEQLAQVVVVDNGSTDRTAEIAAAFGPPVIVVRESQRGYGRACLTGMAALANPEVVVFLDADYSDDAGDLPRILAPIARGRADFVVGSRMRTAEGRRTLPPHSRFGNWLATSLLNAIWGTRWSDLGPFRAIRAEALESLSMRDEDYGWTMEMQIKAARQRLRCAEVPVRYHARIGESKITGTLRGSIGASVKIIYTVARFALGGR